MFSVLQPREDEEDNRESEELNRAVSRDDYQTLDNLLSQDSNKRFINRRSGWGVPSTPLRLAATKGHIKRVKVLLAHGVEVGSLEDVKAQTLLFMAVSNGHRECVKVLLYTGASPASSIYNCSSLLIAARDRDVDILRQLLDHGMETNIQARLPSGLPSRWLVLVPSTLPPCTGFKMLLLYGANPKYNCTEEKVIAHIKEPKTLLETCLRDGCRSEFIELLIDFGANVYLPNVTVDETASHSQGLELLLQAGLAQHWDPRRRFLRWLW